jgi:hypothetical protein
MDAHSLAVKVPGRDAAAVVARADLLRVERSIRPGRKGKGALIGLGAGFAIGFVGAALLGNCDETGGTDHCVNGVWGSLYGAAAGVAGAGLVALVAPGERRAEVPVGLVGAPIGGHGSSARVEVVLLLGRRHGLAIAVSFR